MSDFDIVRDALTFASPTGDETHDALAALDRIEAEYNKWQDLFADLVDENTRLRERLRERSNVYRRLQRAEAENARLRRIEEAAQEHLAYDGDYCSNAKRLRTALEGGGR